MGDKDQLKRALLNVVLNSIQAMPDGGKLTIAVLPNFNNCVPEIKITVRDTGPGIPPDHLPRLFDLLGTEAFKK